MTHSLEVASICRSLLDYLLDKYPKSNKTGKFLRKTKHHDYYSLLTTIGSLHDIGHPPFGHAGETALNFKMFKDGGFEGNAQTLRLLTNLEQFKSRFGLDLTRRTLLGILKYPAPYSSFETNYPTPPVKNREIIINDWEPPKCFYDSSIETFNWLVECFSKSDKRELSKTSTENSKKKTKHKSFDCSIMDLADDISYSVHDLEDAISLKLIKKEDLEGTRGFKSKIKISKLFSTSSIDRKIEIGSIIHSIIKDISIVKQNKFSDEILDYKVVLGEKSSVLIESLKKLIKNKVIYSHEIQTTIYGGMMAVMQLFDAISINHKELMPESFQKQIDNTTSTVKRATCDYISGMTDDYAIKLHKRLYGSTPGSTFDKI